MASIETCVVQRKCFEDSTLRPMLKHMAYYLAPFKNNDQWARNVNELFRRIKIFDGRRIVAVAHGLGMHDPRKIRELFHRRGCEVHIVPHQPSKYDSNGFPSLLRLHYPAEPDAVLWYGHGKGVSANWNRNGRTAEHLQWWRNTMYHYTLDRWEQCLELLKTHSCVGTHRMGQGGVFKNRYKWHFAGTFFWVRCADLYGQPDWSAFDESGYCSELYMGDRFPYEQSACLAYDQWCPRTKAEFGDRILDHPGYVEILREWQGISL